MGIDLNPQIVKFFMQRMSDHSAVAACKQIDDEESFLFYLERNNGMPPLTVHLSDAYFYGIHDFLTRPKILKGGDFVLVARPEGGFGDDVVEMATPLSIGIGQIGKFMGAINKAKCWEYITPDERKRRFERDSLKRK